MSTRLEDDPQLLRLQMQKLRRQMDRDFQLMMEKSQQMFDWRNYVREFPTGMIALGVLAGFLVSPGRKVIPSVRLADESVKKLAEQAVGTQQQVESPSSSWIAGALTTLGGIALSSAGAILKYKIEQWLVSGRDTTSSRDSRPGPFGQRPRPGDSVVN